MESPTDYTVKPIKTITVTVKLGEGCLHAHDFVPGKAAELPEQGGSPPGRHVLATIVFVVIVVVVVAKDPVLVVIVILEKRVSEENGVIVAAVVEAALSLEPDGLGGAAGVPRDAPAPAAGGGLQDGALPEDDG